MPFRHALRHGLLPIRLLLRYFRDAAPPPCRLSFTMSFSFRLSHVMSRLAADYHAMPPPDAAEARLRRCFLMMSLDAAATPLLTCCREIIR